MKWLAFIVLCSVMLMGCVRSYDDVKYPEQRWMPGTQ
jgi:hypothetical protein